jgi:phospholipase/carboxylesterase
MTAIVLQRPEASSTAAGRLVLLFHGVGSSAEDLAPLGEALAPHLPGAWVVSVRSPDPGDFGQGWQWFSVRGITEETRPARVGAALPVFEATVREWQRTAGATAATTTLIGFSQGAIMGLASTQSDEPIAGRVVAIAGRFAEPPRVRPCDCEVNLLHGDVDPVMPVALARQARDQLSELGARVTLDVLPGLGHGIDGRVIRRLIELVSPSPNSVA